jgi:hypothetical protein
MDMRLGGLQSRSGRCEEAINLMPLPGIELHSSVVHPQYNHCTDSVIPVSP